MAKMDALQNALNSSSGRTPTPPAAPVLLREDNPAPAARAKAAVSSREGKENIAAWLPSNFKKSIRLVQAKKPGDPSLQDLMAEAFNDLFSKYNVPTVTE